MDNAEVWKDVPHYEGLYQVSNYGNVYSIRRNRKLTPIKHSHGYLQVHLTNQYGKHKHEFIHRLVALAFLEKEEGYTEVDHIDTDKTNNTVWNLQWTDRRGNMNNPLTIERLKQVHKPKEE